MSTFIQCNICTVSSLIVFLRLRYALYNKQNISTKITEQFIQKYQYFQNGNGTKIGISSCFILSQKDVELNSLAIAATVLQSLWVSHKRFWRVTGSLGWSRLVSSSLVSVQWKQIRDPWLHGGFQDTTGASHFLHSCPFLWRPTSWHEARHHL